MKYVFVILVFIALMACNSGGEGVSVQHDTVKNEKSIAAFTKEDSVLSDGEYIRHYKNGVIKMRGIMKEGHREGLWKSWYDNGLPWSETTFSEGKKNGKTITWYENGNKRYEGFYKDDAESGKWIFWDEKGKVVKEKDYEAK